MNKPTLNIVVNSDGVETVQFCGAGWQDEEALTLIYQAVKPLIRQMDQLLKDRHETVN